MVNGAEDVQEDGSQGEPREVERGATEDALKPVDAAARASAQLAQLTGRESDGVVAIQATDDGWLITLESIEMARIPPSTDLIGVYEVSLDRHGDLRGYERVRRHVRGQAGEDHP